MASAPLVQCLTNTVVANFTANALLAAGASPAMVEVPGEAGPFARIASAVLVNLGTPHAEQRRAMVEAATAAGEAGTPWVLDPVAVGSLPVRTELAHRLLALRPTVVRGNPSEVLALADRGTGGRGVDATATAADAADAADHLAREHGCVVTVSGPADLVTDGDRACWLEGGHPLLTEVTGGGCALGALVAASLADEPDAYAATVRAVTRWGDAAARAAKAAAGPGSFAVALLDELAAS
jgi:hydroxyethylthiazole kinase